MKNGNANCSNCPYGVEDKEDPLTVSCRRYPPVFTNTRTLQDGEEYDHFQFPAMGTDGVCGEHPNFFAPKAYKGPGEDPLAKHQPTKEA